MNSMRRPFGKVFVVTGVILTVLLFAPGCKEEPAAQQASTQAHASDHSDDAGPSHAEEQVAAAADETTEAAAATVAAAIEQTTCPVMAGNPINKTLFVEYEGKKVYFCCKGCEDKFLADPAQYVAKLPQFEK